MSVGSAGSGSIRPDFEITPEGDRLLEELQAAQGSGPAFLAPFDTAAGLKALGALLKADGKIDAADVKRLVTEAKDFGRITTGEKKALRDMLFAYSRKFTPEAREALSRFLGIMPSRPAIPEAPVGPAAPPAAAGPASGSAGLDRANAQLPPIEGKRYEMTAEGFPKLAGGPASPPKNDAAGAELVYRAGNALVEAPQGVLRGTGVATQEKIIASASSLYDQALATSGGMNVRSTDAEKMRSGAAAELLAVIEGADSPVVMNKAAGAYLDRALNEPNENLRASMFRNIEKLQGTLSAENAAKVHQLKSRVIPQAPPYAEWFDPRKNPTGTLEVRHYAHDDCWEYGPDPVSKYREMGLTETRHGREGGEEVWEFKGKIPDPTGKNPNGQQVHVKLYKTHDEFMRDLDDPNVHAIFYTGHSNLGGNVSEAVKRGPEENGTKLLHLGMCRGQQNMFEVANKYPHAHLSTTRDPHYFHNMQDVVANTLKGIAARESWEEIDRRSDVESNNLIRPNEPSRYQYIDQDRDGRMELDPLRGDRFFDVIQSEADPGVTDLEPRAEARAARDIDGEKVVDGVNFARTLITYHNEHGAGNSPLAGIDGDRFFPDGWFEGDAAKEPVRITEERGKDGKPVYKVAVNKAFAGQGVYALGALVQYEIFKKFSEKDGAFSADEKARALVATGEYLAYMYCTESEANAIMRAIGKRAGVSGLTYDTVSRAIESDDHGYATDAQTAALKRMVTIR